MSKEKPKEQQPKNQSGLKKLLKDKSALRNSLLLQMILTPHEKIFK